MLHRITGWLTGGNKINANFLMLGLDAAGKTTILYKMKLGEIKTVIPTIGFNLETIEYKKLSIKCWDVGGCDKIRPLWRHYLQDLDAIIFVVDMNDRERMDEAEKELRTILDEAKLVNGDRTKHLLVFLNKQDLPNKMKDEEAIEKLGLKNIPLNVHTQPSCAITGEGLHKGFDWLNEAVGEPKLSGSSSSNNNNNNTTNTSNGNSTSNSGNNNSTPSPNNANNANPNPANANPAARPPPQPPFRSPSDALSNDEFLRDFENSTLPSWDHKTHLRIAYLNLRKHGRREGVRKIRAGLQNFIAKSEITNRNRYHETMTYFWLQMVHFAMSTNGIPLTWNPSINAAEDVAEFDAFLEKNTHLMNGGLFLEYYTRDLMLNNPTARTEFVVPDLKPLPNIVN